MTCGSGGRSAAQMRGTARASGAGREIQHLAGEKRALYLVECSVVSGDASSTPSASTPNPSDSFLKLQH